MIYVIIEAHTTSTTKLHVLKDGFYTSLCGHNKAILQSTNGSSTLIIH